MDSSKPRRSKLFGAKWKGKCGKCGDWWKPGDMICYENDVLVHATCPVKRGNGGLKPKDMILGRNVPIAIDDGTADMLQNLDKKVFVPSVFQQAIFDWVVNGHGNAVVEAVAGSGKTTTIVEAMKLMPTNIRILFLAFNRHIVKELKARLAQYDHITVRTVHGLGRSIIAKYSGFKDVDNDKINYLMDDFWPIKKSVVTDPMERAMNRNKRYTMRQVISLVKATLTDWKEPDAILKLLDTYDFELDEQVEQEILEHLPGIMKKSIADLEIIDYGDMPYLPQVNKKLAKMFDQYDFILIDEAQDLNECNTQLILKCLAPNGRIIAVGDRYQSMYGWAGANVDSIPRLIERLQATTLPLSISYRCPKKHVENVQDIVPQIQPSPTAKDGVLETIMYDEMKKKLEVGDMVLCRTNAPLVKPAFELIRAGKKAVIRGKDIGSELVNFVDRFNADSLQQLDIVMAEWAEKESNRLIEKGKELQADMVMDKFITIQAISVQSKDVPDLIKKLTDLFSDENEGVVFSSVHKSKGLEARRVYLMHTELMPHPKSKEGWQREQEYNIKYVAGTRSLSELYIVMGDGGE